MPKEGGDTWHMLRKLGGRWQPCARTRVHSPDAPGPSNL